jgi:hypothetical protein
VRPFWGEILKIGTIAQGLFRQPHHFYRINPIFNPISLIGEKYGGF